MEVLLGRLGGSRANVSSLRRAARGGTLPIRRNALYAGISRKTLAERNNKTRRSSILGGPRGSLNVSGRDKLEEPDGLQKRNVQKGFIKSGGRCRYTQKTDAS